MELIKTIYKLVDGIFAISYKDDRVILNVQNGKLTLSQKLQHMLGFESHIFGNGEHRATFEPNLNTIDALYVYSDVCEHSLIGDTAAPLLRIVPVLDEYEFHRIHYFPVAKSKFETMEIDIRDRAGEKKYHLLLVRRW